MNKPVKRKISAGGSGSAPQSKRAKSVKNMERSWHICRTHQQLSTTELNTPHRITSVQWLSDWGLNEALRELLVNMIDQAKEVSRQFYDNAEVSILEEASCFAVHIGDILLAEAKWYVRDCPYVSKYQEDGKIKSHAVGEAQKVATLMMEMTNYSSQLPWQSFLIGTSSKKNSKCVIGQHGEGLSAACVALTRIGCNLSAICTNNEYAARVVRLKDNVHVQLTRRPDSQSENARLPTSAVQFKLVFNPATCETINMEKLLDEISLPTTVTKITTTRGELLTDPAHKGKYFNRGIFVEHCPKSLFGYNFYDPDKNLLAGRDRNSHAKNIGQECWAILSEAITQDKHVCESVLDVFLYAGSGAPGASGMGLQVYDDIKEGEFVSEEALAALRRRGSIRHGAKKAIFCSFSSVLLDLISKMKGKELPVVFSHSVLHTHVPIVQGFNTHLARNATSFKPASRIGALQGQLLPLLQATALLRSPLYVTTVGFWRVGDIVYVTASDRLASDEYLSPRQEYTIHSSLQCCGVDLNNTIAIMRLLRGEEDDSDDSESDSEAEARDKPKKQNKSKARRPPTPPRALTEKPKVSAPHRDSTKATAAVHVTIAPAGPSNVTTHASEVPTGRPSAPPLPSPILHIEQAPHTSTTTRPGTSSANTTTDSINLSDVDSDEAEWDENHEFPHDSEPSFDEDEDDDIFIDNAVVDSYEDNVSLLGSDGSNGSAVSHSESDGESERSACDTSDDSDDGLSELSEPEDVLNFGPQPDPEHVTTPPEPSSTPVRAAVLVPAALVATVNGAHTTPEHNFLRGGCVSAPVTTSPSGFNAKYGNPVEDAISRLVQTCHTPMRKATAAGYDVAVEAGPIIVAATAQAPSTPSATIVVPSLSAAAASVLPWDVPTSPATSLCIAEGVAVGDSAMAANVGAVSGSSDQHSPSVSHDVGSPGANHSVFSCTPVRPCPFTIVDIDGLLNVQPESAADNALVEADMWAVTQCSPASTQPDCVHDSAVADSPLLALHAEAPAAQHAPTASIVSTAPPPPASLSLLSSAGSEVCADLVGRHAATGILLYSNDSRGDAHGQLMLDTWVQNPAARQRLRTLTSMVNIAAFSVVGLEAAGDSLPPALLVNGNCLCVNLLSRAVPFSATSLRELLRGLLRDTDLLDMEF